MHLYPRTAAVERQADAGIAARRLDNGAALFQDAFLLGPIDHRNADAVLYRIARVQALHLRQDRRLYLVLLCNIIDPDDRRIPDQAQNILVKFHYLGFRLLPTTPTDYNHLLSRSLSRMTF